MFQIKFVYYIVSKNLVCEFFSLSQQVLRNCEKKVGIYADVTLDNHRGQILAKRNKIPKNVADNFCEQYYK